MSRVNYIKCDICNVLTENPYARKDWITIDSGFCMTKAKGNYNGNCYETEYLKTTGEKHFCSEHCFIEFLKKEKMISQQIQTPEKPKLKGDELVSTFIM